MKIKKENRKDVLSILETFVNFHKFVISENKIIIPKYVGSYLKYRLNESEATAGMVGVDYGDNYYYIEKVENKYYLTRNSAGDEAKVLLTKQDLQLIDDIGNITEEDVKRLAKTIDHLEMRFGL